MKTLTSCIDMTLQRSSVDSARTTTLHTSCGMWYSKYDGLAGDTVITVVLDELLRQHNTTKPFYTFTTNLCSCHIIPVLFIDTDIATTGTADSAVISETCTAWLYHHHHHQHLHHHRLHHHHHQCWQIHIEATRSINSLPKKHHTGISKLQ